MLFDGWWNLKSQKNTPRPGIEPGPPGWKPGILTPRPSGTRGDAFKILHQWNYLDFGFSAVSFNFFKNKFNSHVPKRWLNCRFQLFWKRFLDKWLWIRVQSVVGFLWSNIVNFVQQMISIITDYPLNLPDFTIWVNWNTDSPKICPILIWNGYCRWNSFSPF